MVTHLILRHLLAALPPYAPTESNVRAQGWGLRLGSTFCMEINRVTTGRERDVIIPLIKLFLVHCIQFCSDWRRPKGRL